MPAHESCQNCRFFIAVEREKIGGKHGLCVRHAPRPVVGSLSDDEENSPNLSINWPVSFADEWCGEFQLAPE